MWSQPCRRTDSDSNNRPAIKRVLTIATKKATEAAFSYYYQRKNLFSHCRINQRFQFAVSVHLSDDVASTNQLALNP